MALPTHGRVVIETTAGDLDIELWSKETPRTCRNFIALAMEGYYDGVIFHRIVKDFLIQTGDRTGTGGGGESFYGEPFEDEIHPRLRFAHRGIVGMANNGTKDSNDSQFFVTLDRADELHGKHTLFGRCIGDTIFNALKIGSMECDENERPLYPPKIKSIRIVDNPFDDIVPRITAAEKRVQQQAREQAQREREEEQRRRGAKKNTKLLSFQDEAVEDEEDAAFKKKSISRTDLIVDPNRSVLLKDFVAPPPTKQAKHKESPEVPEPKKKGDDVDVTKIRQAHAQEKLSVEKSRNSEIEKLEKEIHKLNDKRLGRSDSDDERAKKKAKTSAYSEEMARYEQARGLKAKKSGKKRGNDEDDILAKMSAFRGKLKGTLADGPDPNPGIQLNYDEAPQEPSVEVDDDTGFMSHILHFPKDDGEETRKAERDYEVIDPRQRSARAREEERQRKKQIRPRDGGRGSSRRGAG